MTELLPSREAEQFRGALTDYLTTTFAFADADAEEELGRLLKDPDRGIFRGPYVRLRLPFRAAEPGWRELIGWDPLYPPHAHQAAAWRRLTSRDLGDGDPGPHPTLVTTGTGSGKTEAFLYPVLDHVMRMNAAGQTGIKALILYPMNALANDQARRIAELITGEATKGRLGGIRAALYTGQRGKPSSLVTPDSLITNRDIIRENPPDILLTNYKMLDQLLLRRGDRRLWSESAESLRYLVLDEFHSYDGAQGTDVAMLLRRLGLVLKRSLPDDAPEYVRQSPLGYMTPVATSATLGDKGDPAAMISFAKTVFGVDIPTEGVVTETRLTVEEWAEGTESELQRRGLVPRELDNRLVHDIVATLSKEDDRGESVSKEADIESVTRKILSRFYEDSGAAGDVVGATEPLTLLKGHPAMRQLIELTEKAIKVDDLIEEMLPRGYLPEQNDDQRFTERRAFITQLLAALSHLRAEVGFGKALDVSLHLWVRELTRMDRRATSQVYFDWADDGELEASDDGAPAPTTFPALYCRHCGRSGWGIVLAPTGNDLEPENVDPRAKHLAGDGRFRSLIHAPREQERFEAGETIEGLRWLDPIQRQLLDSEGRSDQALPVLAITSDGADDAARDDMCPSCRRAQGIRFVGSAIATQLSVAVTALFGEAGLDETEKKALVFTDSVQDAAYRAGFVQSRAHVFALRNAISRAVAGAKGALNLSDLVDRMIELATTPAERFLLLPPDIATHDNFVGFWNKKSVKRIEEKTKRRVRKRLLLDVELEFGLQSRVGRTLELTGAVAGGVQAGEPAQLEAIARKAVAGTMHQPELAIDHPIDELQSGQLLHWVRGVLERMRERGAIEHDWYRKYIQDDGSRWFISGGRPRGEGMPAFPEGRDAPAYPRIGNALPTNKRHKSGLDNALSNQSWYTTWARDTLSVTAQTGAHLSRALFAELERANIAKSYPTKSGATVYSLLPERVAVEATDLAGWESGRYSLICPVCESKTIGRDEVIEQLNGAPCTSARCPGTLWRSLGKDNYYRKLYTQGQLRRVVAHEHTGLLSDKDRLTYETQFKTSANNPDAPNVLVATPTLEMGIDIGDLSTVMLTGIPRSVANYLQRVGRAGRATGNALNLAFVAGRGNQLPRLADPLTVIDGAVRPPASYLNAEEILQRQYFASIFDRRATTGTDAHPPTQARWILRSAEPGTFLGDTVADAEKNAERYLADFVGAFTELEPWAIGSLTTFATAAGGPGTSPLAETLFGAVKRWQGRLEHLVYRLDQVETSLPELKLGAEHPAAEENDKTDYRAAKATHRGIKRQISDMGQEHWVSALESLGILPNYTLLDDSVELDVQLSWYDPDNNDYQNETDSFERGASTAIRELVPGAVFYAHGLEIVIDAVDLGADGDNVHEWQLCPACGYALDTTEAEAPATVCPRCGSTKITDTGQRMAIARLERVSSEVRRDEAAITDRADERRQTGFVIHAAADIDPAAVTAQWYLEGTGLSLRYCRDMPIRWINLGLQMQSGLPRYLAGAEFKAPLFRVCRLCGKLDRSTNTNSRTEHRAWCPNRNATKEDTKQLALMRELRTQGIVLRVPPAVTISPGPLLSSFAAAILLGLREVIGGDPDHLRIETIVDPVFTDGSDNATALLIHDTVPGGTGYLADLANPNRMRDVLEAAYQVVKSCPCAEEGKAACYRCLLPFAPGRAAKTISRAAAEKVLASLLIDRDGNQMPWEELVVHHEPPKQEPPLESRFRAVLVDRLQKLGANIRDSVDATGQVLTVTLPGGMVWVCREQVLIDGKVKPDFTLEYGPNRVAIFTDGQLYHASTQNNRIRDDAEKRRYLRDQGYLVLALSWDDVDQAASGARPTADGWFDLARATPFAQLWQLPAHALAHVTANPVDQLLEFIQNPSIIETWERIGAALPMLLWDGKTFHDLGDASVSSWLAGVLDGSSTGIGERAASFSVMSVMTQRSFTAMAGRLKSLADFDLKSLADFDTALLIDDRTTALEDGDFGQAWRIWLRWSNLLGIRPPGSAAYIGALTELIDASERSERDEPLAVSIPAEWEALIAGATDTERELITKLAAIPDLPLPEIGAEVGDGIPLAVSWPDLKVAVDLGLLDDDRPQLAELGWTLTPPDPAMIETATASRAHGTES